MSESAREAGTAEAMSAGEAARRLGVAATTVRTWDRRYGLGPRSRQPGRHRRYDENDLARLALMRQLTLDGVAAAEAARVAREAEGPISRDVAVPPSDGDVASRARASRGLARAAMALDTLEIERILAVAFRDGVISAWTEIICPTFRQIERRYVATGGFIEAERVLSTGVSRTLGAVTHPVRRADVLLACTADELHSLPLEALSAALAEAGRGCRMLGARVPSRALADALARTGPVAVILWAQSAATAQVDQLEVVLAARPRPVLVAACGPGWEGMALPAGVASPGDLPAAVSAVMALP